MQTYKTSKFALPRVDIPDSKLDIWSMEPNSPQDKAKRAAGVQAIATYLKSGMKIGLGSGIEVIPFGWRTTEGHLKKLFSDFGWTDIPIKVRGGLQTPLITDSGHYLLDCELDEIGDRTALL